MQALAISKSLEVDRMISLLLENDGLKTVGLVKPNRYLLSSFNA
jgi:hypothetical protein